MSNVFLTPLMADLIKNAGTSEGAIKGWQTRGKTKEQYAEGTTNHDYIGYHSIRAHEEEAAGNHEAAAAHQTIADHYREKNKRLGGGEHSSGGVKLEPFNSINGHKDKAQSYRENAAWQLERGEKPNAMIASRGAPGPRFHSEMADAHQRLAEHLDKQMSRPAFDEALHKGERDIEETKGRLLAGSDVGGLSPVARASKLAAEAGQ